MAQRAAKVIGVEGVEEAVQDAQKNAALNGIENAQFFAGDMRKVLNEDFFEREGVPDVVMTDPELGRGCIPMWWLSYSAQHRRGSFTSAVIQPPRRDVALLKEAYQVSKSQAVDMFPQTAHVENVLCLDRWMGQSLNFASCRNVTDPRRSSGEPQAPADGRADELAGMTHIWSWLVSRVWAMCWPSSWPMASNARVQQPVADAHRIG